tara:strand:- start:1758 stop:3737 length:1980 start_codon:yes stop_codon:yes gene_type:complete
MSKRKYVKSSDYWNKFNKEDSKSIDDFLEIPVVGPSSAGEPYYVESKASYSRTKSNSEDAVSRRNNAHKSDKKYRFSNISGGMLPYVYSSDGVNVRETIELCQKAYANISVFRNAIDVMSEFANSNVYLEGGTQNSRDFVYKWFDRINLWNLKDQYFREYYRSGNIFLYRVDGKFSKSDFDKLTKIYGSSLALKPGKLPVKYILLNPYDIVATKGSSFETGLYEKILSDYDIERLKNPKTDYDQQVYEALDPEIKEKIKTGKYNSDGIRIKLDPGHLVYSFYKKQDYEPFAIPFGFPVLDDINFKLELKQIDQAICRTIENVILLITMGAEPDKGGINPRNMEAMQNLFKNESVGRVLVSDHTTKAQFIIPDIGKVVGPAKYEVINNDIKEGLQNVIVGDERYSNTQVKAKIFLERLEESRNAFIYDFLQPQVKMVCQNLGFRKYPTVKFEQTDIKDEVQLQRVATRLIELGVITPEQGMDVLAKGYYPKPEEMEPAQKEYIKQRKSGLYNPIVGGAPVQEQNSDVKENEKQVKKEVGRPIGASDVPKQASAGELFSRKDLQGIIYSTEELRNEGYKRMRKKLKKNKLKNAEKTMIDELCESVIISHSELDWSNTLLSCIDDPNRIESLITSVEIQELSVNHNLDLYSAALLYHSNRRG